MVFSVLFRYGMKCLGHARMRVNCSSTINYQLKVTNHLYLIS